MNKLKSLAADLGLDTSAFNECLDSDKNAQEVQKDLEDGTQYGVQGTPSFYINGVNIPGAQPFANFKAIIDAALAEGG